MALAVLSLAGSGLLMPLATSDFVEPTGKLLPTGRDLGAAVWTGSQVLWFGGQNGFVNYQTVTTYTPSTDSLSSANKFAVGQNGHAAVWVGPKAYILGGHNGNYLTAIRSYDPGTQALVTLAATLPVPIARTTAIWDGANVYMFGGWTSAAVSGGIVRFNPVTNVVETLPTALPSPWASMSAVWTGEDVFLFGGQSTHGLALSDQILRFRPGPNTIETLTARLPSPRALTSAFWDGESAYIIGGLDATSTLNEIVRFDPATNVVEVLPDHLDFGRSATSAVWADTRGFVLAGCSGAANPCNTSSKTTVAYLREVTRITPEIPVEGTSEIADTLPSCAQPVGAGCGPDTLGFADDFELLPDGAMRFDFALGDFDGHADRNCAATDSCGHWLKVAMTASGRVSGALPDGSAVVVGKLFWLDLSGVKQPPSGIPISGVLRLQPDGNEGQIEFPPSYALPNQAFRDAMITEADGRTVALRFEPQAGSPPWTVSLEGAQVQLVAPPVLLLHGGTRESGLRTYVGWTDGWQDTMPTWLQDEATLRYGQDPWAWSPSPAIRPFMYDRKQDYRNSAEQAIDAISDARFELAYDEGRVDLVAHSMGGLVSRHAAEEEPEGVDRVRKVITMATPHRGFELADANVIWNDHFLQPGGEPERDRFYIGDDQRNVGRYTSSWDQLPRWRQWWDPLIEANRFNVSRTAPLQDFLADFEVKPQDGRHNNPVVRELNEIVGRPDLEIYPIAGRAQIQACTLNHCRTISYGGDGLVGLGSATLDKTADLCWTVVNLEDFIRRAHNAIPNNAIVRGLVLDRLAGNLNACQAAVGPDVEAPANTAPAETPASSQGLRPEPAIEYPTVEPIVRGEIWCDISTGECIRLPDQTVGATLRWNISAVENATLIALLPRGSAANLTFELAYNGTVDSAASPASDEIGWAIVNGGDYGDMMIAQIAAPRDGNVALFVRLDETKRTDDSEFPHVGAWAEFDTTLHLRDLSEGAAFVGNVAVLRVRFTDENLPVLGAEVVARITETETERNTTLSLRDDGLVPDALANDGEYAGAYPVVSDGAHEYRVTGTSTHGTRQVEHALIAYPHPPPSVKITPFP